MSVTTRQASALLGVHESSVKRWCNAGDLACWLTPGGHRRIRIAALVAFAEAQDLALALRGFETHAEAVWAGAERARRDDDFDDLATLAYGWIERGWSRLPALLIGYLTREGFALAQVFDRLAGPVMHRIGIDYLEGRLSIGDEHRMTQAMRDALIGMHLIAPGEEAPGGEADRPTAIVGCARNEVHELGALMVRRVLEAHGWHVIYLGLNVPTEEFAAQQAKYAAALVCVSMMPPMGRAEAQTMVRLLGHMHDPARPYHLVLGGPSVGTLHLDGAESPLLGVRGFSAMEPFARWIQTHAR